MEAGAGVPLCLVVGLACTRAPRRPSVGCIDSFVLYLQWEVVVRQRGMYLYGYAAQMLIPSITIWWVADMQYFSSALKVEISFFQLDLMLTRQVVLLLVGAMNFVAVRAAITKTLEPYVLIIKNSHVYSTIHQTPMCKLLESILGVKGGWSPSNPWLTSLWIYAPANFGRLVHQSVYGSCSEFSFGNTDFKGTDRLFQHGWIGAESKKSVGHGILGRPLFRMF